MRKMFSKKQVEEISKEVTQQNSTQLYKHSFSFSFEDGTPIENAPTWYLINNSAEPLNKTLSALDFQHMEEDGENIKLISNQNSILFPYYVYDTTNDYFMVIASSTETFISIEEPQDEQDPTIYTLKLTDYYGDLESVVVQAQDDIRPWFNMKVIDIVEAL